MVEFPNDYRVAFIPLKSVVSTGTSTLDKGLIFSFLYDRSQVLYIDIACSRLRENKTGGNCGEQGLWSSLSLHFSFFPPPTFRVPFTLASSPLSESLEQANIGRERFRKVLTTGVKIAAYSFHTHYEMGSGPVAVFLIQNRRLKT